MNCWEMSKKQGAFEEMRHHSENGGLFGRRLIHRDFYGIDDAVKDAWKL